MDIYTDGSYCPQTKLAGIGVVCDIITMGLTVKATNHIRAELMSILHGVVWARDGDIVFNDNKVLCDRLSKKEVITNHEDLSLSIIRVMNDKLRWGEEITLAWISRHKNDKAHRLAYSKTCLRKHKNGLR